jgi:hypothetical protein
MNPLSSHPPRTPRTSIVPNSSSTYSNGKYQSSNEDSREKVEIEDIDIDEEEDSVKSVERKIRKEEVWREMFLTSAGRDKAFVSMIMLDLNCMLFECATPETYPIFHSAWAGIPLITNEQSTAA